MTTTSTQPSPTAGDPVAAAAATVRQAPDRRAPDSRVRYDGGAAYPCGYTWSGPARVEICDEPHHLLLTTEPGTEDEAQLEAWLTAEGSRTRLVVEERGLPVDQLHFHGAGWQVHLQDLGRSLRLDAPVHPDGWSATQASPAWHSRWVELTPGYRARGVE